MPPTVTKPAWIDATCKALGARSALPDLTGVDPEHPGWLEVIDRAGTQDVDRIVDHLGPGVAWIALIATLKRSGAGVAGLQSLAEQAQRAPRTRQQETQLRDAILWNLSSPQKFPVVREAFLRWRDPDQDDAFPAFANRCLHESVRQETLVCYMRVFQDHYVRDQVTLESSLPMAAIRSGHGEEVRAHWKWVLSVTPPEALGAALLWALTREDPEMFNALDAAGDWPLPAPDQITAWVSEPEAWETYDQLGVRDPEGLPVRPALRARLDAALRPLHDHLPQTHARARERDLSQRPAPPLPSQRRRT